MNKKFFYLPVLALLIVLSLYPAMALADGDGDADENGATTTATLPEADESGVITLTTSGTYTLTDNVTASIVVDANATVTLNLNGHTVSSSTDHAITNNGVLTVVDNGDGESGKVDGGDTSAKGALYNAPGATANLNGGIFTGSKWYVIKNLGTMTIDGASVEQNDIGSSAIDNGFFGSNGHTNDCGVSPATDQGLISLTISSGSVSGGINCVKNDDYGKLTISGGEFTTTASNGAVIMNWNEASISGGTFTGNGTAAVVSNGYGEGGADEGKLTISGGDFIATDDGDLFGTGSDDSGAQTTISGGTFTGTPNNVTVVETTVKDGTFSAPVNAEWLDEDLNYQAEKTLADGTTKEYTYHKTAEEAAQAAEGGAVEEVSADATSSTAFTITFDANDGTYTGPASVKLLADEDGKATYKAPDATSATRSGHTLSSWQIWTPAEDVSDTPGTGDGTSSESTSGTSGETTTDTTNGTTETTDTTVTEGTNTNETTGDGENPDNSENAGDDTTDPTPEVVWVNSNETVAPGAQFTLTSDVKLVAVWSRNSSGGGHSSSSKNYTITVDSTKNGDVTVSPKSAATGTTVTITVEPDEGYELDDLTVTDANGKTVKVTAGKNGKYTFTMPASKVTVEAAFAKISENVSDDSTNFTDVKASAWYAEAVQYVADKGMMQGTDSKTFSPNDNTTRGQIVTVLYRLEQEPAAGTAAFTDVAAGQYYAKAVAWAADKDIVKGYTETTFAPNDNITREQIAAILFRYAEYKGIATNTDGNLTTFTDAAKVSDWAEDAMKWSVGCGLLQGDNGALNPQGNATRAEIATMLMRFCENVAK